MQSWRRSSLLALPAAWVLRGSAQQRPRRAAPRRRRAGARETTRAGDRAGRCATRAIGCSRAGFFVCGFHVAFIATHLPGVVAACQLPPAVGAWSLGDDRPVQHRRQLRDGLGGRPLAHEVAAVAGLCDARRSPCCVFLLAPKTEAVVLVFAAVIGLTYLSTVPPTAGLVAKFFGTAHMATLFGFVMLSHQVGGFLGAWLGGKAFEWTGSYDWMWYADIVLAVGAALIHLPIREARLPPRRRRRCRRERSGRRPSAAAPCSSAQPAAVDIDDLAGHVARRVAEQEGHDVGDLLGLAEAAAAACGS